MWTVGTTVPDQIFIAAPSVEQSISKDRQLAEGSLIIYALGEMQDRIIIPSQNGAREGT